MKRGSLFFLFLSIITVVACIWDGDTLENEKKKHPQLADIVLGNATAKSDPKPLQARIEKLKASPREDDPDWWNDLAGAYLRLDEPEHAVQLLQPLLERFPDNYGIHANLGTAYHLLGRYAEAEKHISRDLEINPKGHFRLEKYHLALLQYLLRDREYQRTNLYVFEWMEEFQQSNPEDLTGVGPYPISPTDLPSADLPAYLSRFSLANDPKFEEGVLYMAGLNPKEPACFVMLGIVCSVKRDFNLAIAAWEKAIALGSPQADLLREKIKKAQQFVDGSLAQRGVKMSTPERVRPSVPALVIVLILGVGFVGWLGFEAGRRRRH